MRCPQHGHDCPWYRDRSDGAPDVTGIGLNYDIGLGNGRAFARCHQPMLPEQLPYSHRRGDDFALGFHFGVWTGWCVDHPPYDCRGHWSCQQKILTRAGLR
jgi:hypothetical protein